MENESNQKKSNEGGEDSMFGHPSNAIDFKSLLWGQMQKISTLAILANRDSLSWNMRSYKASVETLESWLFSYCQDDLEYKKLMVFENKLRKNYRINGKGNEEIWLESIRRQLNALVLVLGRNQLLPSKSGEETAE